MKTKIGTALLSLLIAFGLWLYVISVVSPESEQSYYNIPVVFNGSSTLEDRGLMMISDKDVKVNLTLSGTRTDLNKLNSSNITIIADLSGITTAGEHVIHYSISYPGSASSGGFTVLEQTPKEITVVVAEWAEKEVPVDKVFSGSLPSEEYMADRQNVILDHSSVTISGPKEIVQQIEKAMITVDLTGRTADFTESYGITLCDANGDVVEGSDAVSKSVAAVKASVKVSMLKTLDIIVNVIPGGGLEEADIAFTLDRTSIKVSGPEAILKDIGPIALDLDLSKLTESRTVTYPITLPSGVTNVTGVNHVNVEVVIPQLTTKIITVTSERFQCINVPEGMQVTILSEQLEIELRGRENRLAELQPENIQVFIDFTDAVEGNAVYTVTIKVIGMENVGAIGEYTVTATLTSQSSVD